MRRLFWMGVGAAAGAGGTVWTQRKVREQLDQLGGTGAEQIVVVAGRGARVVARTVVAVAGQGAQSAGAALGEGRHAMRQREVELRERLHGGDVGAGASWRSTPEPASSSRRARR